MLAVTAKGAPTMSTTATAEPKLRLASYEPDDTLRFERRGADRHVVGGRVTAVQYDTASNRKKITSIQLVNMSATGVGAIVPEGLPLNAPIAIFFPPHGADRGFDLFGTVVRCFRRSDGKGHELGIRFSPRQAA